MCGREISRREFLGKVAGGAFVASLLGTGTVSCSRQHQLRSTMPMRVLGRTGHHVSILAFGAGSQFLKNPDGEWEPLVEKAIELGINLFDTASTYQWSASKSSEERLGEILSRHRDQVLISTKFQSRDPDQARREFERSLRRLRTDHVDFLLIHSIEPDEDLRAIANRLYPWMLRVKEQGLCRFIGFSSMNSAEKSRELLARLDFDVVLLAFNPTRYGNFADIVLPIAREKNVGVLGMKILRDLVGTAATAKELLYYAWDLEGLTSAVVGHFGMKTLLENVSLALQYTRRQAEAINPSELECRLAPFAGPHALCWARTDYVDGCVC